MGFIPEWAVGVAVIVFAVAVAQIVVVKFRASARVPPPPGPRERRAAPGPGRHADRLGELEERLDFTERLLANHHDADRLEPPTH